MPKVTGPLFSLKARGQFGKALIFKRGGIVVNYFKPRNPNSAAQQAQREAFKELYVPGLTQEQADLLYAAILHKHDLNYSPIGHDHNEFYATVSHLHDDRYVKLSTLPTIAQGDYSPVVTGVSNVSSVTLNAAMHYSRLGNYVEVDGSLLVTPLAAGSLQVDISLPIASNFASSYDLNGNATSPAAGVIAGSLIAETAGDKARLVIYSPDGVARYWRLYFRYKVIP